MHAFNNSSHNDLERKSKSPMEIGTHVSNLWMGGGPLLSNWNMKVRASLTLYLTHKVTFSSITHDPFLQTSIKKLQNNNGGGASHINTILISISEILSSPHFLFPLSSFHVLRWKMWVHPWTHNILGSVYYLFSVESSRTTIGSIAYKETSSTSYSVSQTP